MKNVIGTAGVFNFSPTDHNGLDIESFAMLTVKDGKFSLLEKVTFINRDGAKVSTQGIRGVKFSECRFVLLRFIIHIMRISFASRVVAVILLWIEN